MKKLLFLIIVSLVLAGAANATTVWNPVANGIVPPDVGNWNEAANWTEGVPVSFGDSLSYGTHDKGVLNVAGSAECVVNDAQEVYALVLGDGGTGTVASDNVLRITNGGYLSIGDVWMALGYDNPATLIVEKGGEMYSTNHLWWGMQAGSAGSVAKINGGTVICEDAFQLGRLGGACKIYLNAGLLDARYLPNDDDDQRRLFSIAGEPGSLMDVSFGQFTVGGNRLAILEADALAGRITAFGGLGGTLVIDYNETTSGHTSVTATGDPLNRYPTYDDIVEGGPTLSWVNLAPNAPETNVWVDVWLGTDPAFVQDESDPNIWDYVDFVKIESAVEDLTSVVATTPTDGEYLWRVDSYLDGDPCTVTYGLLPDDGDPNTPEPRYGPSVAEGVLMAFFATDDFPATVVIDTLPTATWANKPIQLNATITDPGIVHSPVTILWESDEPNAVFKDPGTLLEDNTIEDPTVTVNYNSGAFNVTVTVSDDSIVPAGPDATDTVDLDCRQNACAAGRNAVGLAGDYPADATADCEHDLADFAIIANDWLIDYALTEPMPIP